MTQTYLQRIVDFKLPAYNDLPTHRFMCEELCELVNRYLGPLWPEEDKVLTQTMVQNYSKANLLPKINGRKYEREHLAYCLVISLLKVILPLKDLAKGVLLQAEHLTTEEAYSYFCKIWNANFEQLSKKLARGSEIVKCPSLSAPAAGLGLHLACQASVNQIFTRFVLLDQGYVYQVQERARLSGAKSAARTSVPETSK